MYCTQTKFDYDIIFWMIGISRDNDVTIVSALSRIAALTSIFFRNTLRYRYFGWLSSVLQSFTKINL